MPTSPSPATCRDCGNGPQEVKSFCRPCWSQKMLAARKKRKDLQGGTDRRAMPPWARLLDSRDIRELARLPAPARDAILLLVMMEEAAP